MLSLEKGMERHASLLDIEHPCRCQMTGWPRGCNGAESVSRRTSPSEMRSHLAIDGYINQPLPGWLSPSPPSSLELSPFL